MRRDLLLGHLTLLATEGAGPHALGALAAQLAEGGLMPRWVHLTLTQHPDLFYRAFRRMFRGEAHVGADSAAVDSAATWALERFWQRPGLGVGRPAGRVQAGAAGPAMDDAPSRFLTDFQACSLRPRGCACVLQEHAVVSWPHCFLWSSFKRMQGCCECKHGARCSWWGPRCTQELQVLGRGAYGVVVQAVNRLDGRPYAVKKIVMRAASPAARARLMREVSTLARLHHPCIVRYYQARPSRGTALLQGKFRMRLGRCQAQRRGLVSVQVRHMFLSACLQCVCAWCA